MGHLVLSRKAEESIMIGDDVKITVIGIQGGSVRISIEAPREKKIYRQEVYDQILDQNKASVNWDLDALTELSEIETATKQE